MPDPLTAMTHKVPESSRRYVTLAAAKLNVPKAQIVVDALKMHRDYMVTSGVIEGES